MAGKYSTGIPHAGLCKNIDAGIRMGECSLYFLRPIRSLHWENVVNILSHTGYDRTGHNIEVDNRGSEHQRSERQGSQTNWVREECGSPGVWRYVGREQASLTHKDWEWASQSRERSENRHSGTEKNVTEGSCKLLAPMTVKSVPKVCKTLSQGGFTPDREKEIL